MERVNELYHAASSKASQVFANRAEVVESCISKMTHLVFAYFDIYPIERILIDDTNNILMPSTRRRKATDKIPTLRTSTEAARDQYTNGFVKR